MTEGKEPRFLADSMLGRLATWLRLLGCDVEDSRRIPDGELVRRAAEGGRVLLTRDTRLVTHPDLRGRVLFVRGDRYPEQLRQVVRRFGIDPRAKLLTRCVRCNEPLLPVEKEAVRDRVPPYVFRTQETFRRCPACGRIFWRATHAERMERHLAEILAG